MSEYKKNKTNHPKKIKIPTEYIAASVECSTELVNKIRSGKRRATGVKGQRVELAEALFQQEQSKLIDKIKELVKL
ncbi:MAG TPA: hypothetical protein PK431_01480 [Chitinophagales bacterium]|nr:hypothetical protein [Chitinophagales bacterium]